MHANPSTAHPCALDNTSKKARLIQKINDAPASALIKACTRNKSVKEAARKMIAMIERNLARKDVEA